MKFPFEKEFGLRFLSLVSRLEFTTELIKVMTKIPFSLLIIFALKWISLIFNKIYGLFHHWVYQKGYDSSVLYSQGIQIEPCC